MTAEFPLAVHALVYLYHTNRITPSAELADNICTNPARVRKVMTRLHKAGLADAVRGQRSGYRARPNGGDITLCEVLEALDEKPVDMNWRPGDMDRDCLVSSGMGAIMDGFYAQMNEQCAGFLGGVTIRAVNDRIFQSKEQAQ